MLNKYHLDVHRHTIYKLHCPLHFNFVLVLYTTLRKHFYCGEYTNFIANMFADLSESSQENVELKMESKYTAYRGFYKT